MHHHARDALVSEPVPEQREVLEISGLRRPCRLYLNRDYPTVGLDDDVHLGSVAIPEMGQLERRLAPALLTSQLIDDEGLNHSAQVIHTEWRQEPFGRVVVESGQ